jgi:hypothetical protein
LSNLQSEFFTKSRQFLAHAQGCPATSQITSPNPAA